MHKLEYWDDNKSKWIEVMYSNDMDAIYEERTTLHNSGIRECDLRIKVDTEIKEKIK